MKIQAENIFYILYKIVRKWVVIYKSLLSLFLSNTPEIVKYLCVMFAQLMKSFTATLCFLLWRDRGNCVFQCLKLFHTQILYRRSVPSRVKLFWEMNHFSKHEGNVLAIFPNICTLISSFWTSVRATSLRHILTQHPDLCCSHNYCIFSWTRNANEIHEMG